MKFAIYLLYGSYIIHWNQFHLINANPLIGQSVRAAHENEYRGVVSIQYNLEHVQPIEDHICTGTLISREDILTTAHCFDHTDQASGYRISVGTINLLQNTYYYPAWWLTFIQWMATSYRGRQLRYQDNDIAVIRLTSKVVIQIRFSIMAYIPVAQLYGRSGFIAGWGKFANGTNNPILQTVEVKLLNKTECEDRLTRIRGEPSSIEANLICSVAQPRALLTKGDSGGPLFDDDQIVALNKATCPAIENVADRDKMNLHLGIAYYKTFIKYVQDL